MESPYIQKIEKILEYKERINHKVQEILDLIHKGNKDYPKSIDDIEDILLTLKKDHEFREYSGQIEVEIKKKIEDILHSMSCIGSLWREDKAHHMNQYLISIRRLFEQSFQADLRMRYMLIEFTLGYVNSFVLPIHESRKWQSLIEIEPLLAKIKIGIKNF